MLPLAKIRPNEEIQEMNRLLDEFALILNDIEIQDYHSRHKLKHYIWIRIYKKIQSEVVKPWRTVLATDTE